MVQVENKTLRAAIAPALLMGAIWFARSNKYCIHHLHGGEKHLLQTAACGSLGLFLGSAFTENSSWRKVFGISLMVLGLFGYPKFTRSINHRINVSYTPSFYLSLIGGISFITIENTLSPRNITFGKKEWKKYLGIDPGDVPPLPKVSDQFIKENIIVFIPSKIATFPFNLNYLRFLGAQFTDRSGSALKKIGNKGIDSSSWVAISRYPLRNTLNTKLGNMDKGSKELPSALVAATAFVFATLSDMEHGFKENPPVSTVCSDKLGESLENHATVGVLKEDDSSKIDIYFWDATASNCSVGLAGLTRLSQ